MASTQNPTKHHYIPQFYLQWWAGNDGRFERYDRPIPSKIMVRRSFPSETGWLKDLYTSPGDSKGTQWLETKIFQTIDSKAAPALQKMVNNQQLNGEERSNWTTFVRSLFHRTPQNLAGTIANALRIHADVLESTRAKYSTLRTTTDPENFDEYLACQTPSERRKTALAVLPATMANPKLGQFLNDMPTRVFTLPDNVRSFLLSDDPIARTNGLQQDIGHIALPLSPRKLFVSAYKQATLDQITKQKPNELVAAMNKWTVESARYFIAAQDRSQDQFIRNRFGITPKASVLR